MSTSWRILRRLLRILATLFAVLVLVVAVVVLANRAAFGKQAEGERLERMTESPQWDDGVFENPQPLWNDTSLTGMAKAILKSSDFATPENADDDIPVVQREGSEFEAEPESGLRVTWFGHSSMLIEVDGKKVLTDPVWGPSPSPVTWAGPRRWYAPPIELDALPPVDAVLISHDHYDHLDYPTFEVIRDWDTLFFVPLGVGAHLAYWGVPEDRIVELDWWDRRDLAGLTIVCAPARHASGRGVFDQNATLWAGWALIGPEHRVFFSGDTGLFDGMKEIGEKLGPFDVTMLEVGAYNAAWPDWHLGPEQAVLAHQWLQGEVMMPVHWGLFDLAAHGWTEPAERTLVSAREAGVTTAFPRPGESFEPTERPLVGRWWPAVPWETAEEHPVVATAANGNPPKDPS
ncbi:MAG: MBL fold metallo-hydrolase [Myxococcota bacterium]